MALDIPTLDDLKAMRAGIAFNARTRPTDVRAQVLLDEAVEDVLSIMTQIGLTREEIEDFDPSELPQLQAWFNRTVLNAAMAEVWTVIPGTNGNPYRQEYDRLRTQALRQPESVGMPLPEEERWSNKPSTGEATDLPFRGVFNTYLRRTGGF